MCRTVTSTTPGLFSPEYPLVRGFDKTAAVWQRLSPSNMLDLPSVIQIDCETLESVSSQRRRECDRCACWNRRRYVWWIPNHAAFEHPVSFFFPERLPAEFLRELKLGLFLPKTPKHTFKHTGMHDKKNHPHTRSRCAARWCANDLGLSRRSRGRGGAFAACCVAPCRIDSSGCKKMHDVKTCLFR